MFSVLMPARNAERTIGLAVRSTLRALPPDSELFVLDDASTDDTNRVVSTIAQKDRRIKVIRSTTTLGVAGGLNAMLAEASRPWIARMDADDVSLPWRFSAQARALSAGSDLVFSTRINFGSTPTSFRPAAGGAIAPATMPYWLTVGNPVPHSSLAARAEVIRRAGGYTAGPAEDYELWMRLAADRALVRRLALPVIGYRMHAGQVTKAGDWRTRYEHDPALAASHTALLRSLGWRERPVWAPLARRTFGGADPFDAADVRELAAFVRSATPRHEGARSGLRRQLGRLG